MSDQPLWIVEHGEEYEVPAEITGIEGIVDLSWHNDTCPRFSVRDDGIGPSIWVEHPNPDEREVLHHRYLVIVQLDEISSSDDVELYRGDDVTAAVAAFLDEALYRRHERIEFLTNDNWTEAWLLNESRTLRIANLGMWDGKTGWVNDGPNGDERDVNDHALWRAGVAKLASKLTAPNR
jgi:hypothetical protein